ncbi:MAG: AAA family ATPase [bacterium]|nr:AAA family ATPase [bacterium]
MNLRKLTIKRFKSLLDISLKPGNINVLIGANGAGKSSFLEALGMLSAAVWERVDNRSLMDRGVRLVIPEGVLSSFQKDTSSSQSIDFQVDWWQYTNDDCVYELNLTISQEQELHHSWQYGTENLVKSVDYGERIQAFERYGKNVHYEDGIERKYIEIDEKRGFLSFGQSLKTLHFTKEFYKVVSEYVIYTPQTAFLRGIQADPIQRPPVGLSGGRLAEAVDDLLKADGETFGQLDKDDVLDLFDWAADFSMGEPSNILSESVPAPKHVIRFTDRFMGQKKNVLTGYDASEGSLYVLFMLVLAMHRYSPQMFAIDNFDQAMNPRLVRKLTNLFCDLIIQNNRTVFLTTHNPLVLDGLDLTDDRIRLFALDRNSQGHTTIERVVVSKELLERIEKGMTLSRLWVMGHLGGIPNL